MKNKIGLVLLIIGLILIGFGVYSVLDNSNNNGNNNNNSNNNSTDSNGNVLDNYVDNKKIFVNDNGNTFGIIKFIKNGDDYAIIVKTRTYSIKEKKLIIENKAMQYPVILNNNKLVNDEEQFEVDIDNNTLVFVNKNKTENSVFVGKYLLYDYSDKNYNFPKLDDGNHTGLYDVEKRGQSTMILTYFKENGKDGYNITYISNGRDGFRAVDGDVAYGTSSTTSDDYVLFDSMFFTFNNGVLKIQARENGKDIDSLLNGTYYKITTIPYSEYIDDIDRGIPINDGEYKRVTK